MPGGTPDDFAHDPQHHADDRHAHHDPHSGLSVFDSGSHLDSYSTQCHGHDSHNVVGTPAIDALYCHPQREAFTCAVQAQAGIIHEFTGEELTEGHAAVEAAQHGWLTTDGMDPNYVGKSLELHGIAVHTVEHGTVGDLVSELAVGHKVIVGVNAQELWNQQGALSDFNSHAANHAIWVTGVDFSDRAHPKVIINDSGMPDGAGNAYELNDFVAAWKESGYDYVATDNAPPHLEDHVDGFDAEHGVFADLADYLADHAPEIALGSAVAAGAILAIRARRAAASKGTPPTVGVPAPSDAPGPRTALQPTSIVDTSQEERDQLLLGL